MIEVWRDITGYEGLYQVSNFGRVKSLKRKINHPYRSRNVKEKILKSTVDRNGYLHINLYKNGNKKFATIHRLVATTFLNEEKYMEVNHIDGNKTNNNIKNLEWCTKSENIKHTYNKLGRKPSYRKLYNRGIKNKCSKKVIQLTIDNTEIKIWDCLRDVQRELKIGQPEITKCCQGKRKTAGKYKWKYFEFKAKESE